MNAPVPPKRILLLDDEPGVLRMLSEFLPTIGLEPVGVSRWTDALDLITHAPPDLLLLDLHMPTVQGESVLEFLRNQGNPLPVIVISAFLDREKIATLLKMGVSECLSKPFELDRLTAAIHRALQPPPPQGRSAGPTAEDTDKKKADAAPKASTPHPAGSPAPPPHPHAPSRREHRTRPNRRRSNFRVYILIVLVCLLGSLALVLLEQLPSYTNEAFDQAAEKAAQAEIKRQRKLLEGVSRPAQDRK